MQQPVATFLVISTSVKSYRHIKKAFDYDLGLMLMWGIAV
jgi:hypothetical protein